MHKLLIISLCLIIIVVLLAKETFEQTKRPLIDWVYEAVVRTEEDKPRFEKVYIDDTPDKRPQNCAPFDFTF